MAKDKMLVEKNRRKYTIPSGASYQYRAKNAIYISPITLRHELSKCIGAYMLKKWGDIKFPEILAEQVKYLGDYVDMMMKDFPKGRADFITEAVPKCNKDRRIDLVRLNDEQWFEFETNHKIKKENCVTFYV